MIHYAVFTKQFFSFLTSLPSLKTTCKNLAYQKIVLLQVLLNGFDKTCKNSFIHKFLLAGECEKAQLQDEK